MHLPKTTVEYLENGAPKGERNDTLLRAACQCRDSGLSENEALAELSPRARADGLHDREIRTTIHSAFSRNAREPAKGAVSNYTSRYGNSHIGMTSSKNKVSPKKYDLKPTELPEVLDNEFLRFLNATFKPGEFVAIATEVDKDGQRRPKDAGITKTLEEWSAEIGGCDHDAELLFDREIGCGVFVRINPIKEGGKADVDVTGFRHALLESDHISVEEAYSLFTQSKLPIAALIHSGNKSLHAWVRIEAKDRSEYDERVAHLYEHFAEYKLDPKNKNPSRFSRLPQVMRGEKKQKLVAVDIGAKNWDEWIKLQHVMPYLTPKDLISFDTANDTDSVLGDRWLCRGASCLWIGQTGIGKSAIAMQMAIYWAMAKPCFGIKPAKPLKSLFIQAENDTGDLAEMFQGVLTGVGSEIDLNTAYEGIKENLVFMRDCVNLGEKFASSAEKQIEYHKPDLVWVDPLLSFVGDDTSRQQTMSIFLRNLLNPIALKTGVIWMVMHHTGKPTSDSKARSHWTDHDMSYLGLGSSDMMNWARAINVLLPIKDSDGAFKLLLSKRGKRAGARSLTHEYTNSLYLRHAEKGIFWEQIDEPGTVEKSKDSLFKAKYSADQILKYMSEISGTKTINLQKYCNDELGMSRPQFYRFWEELKKAGKIKLVTGGGWVICGK